MDDRTRVQPAGKPPKKQGGKKPANKKRKKKASPLAVFGHMVLNVFKVLFVFICIGAIAAGIIAVGVVNYVVEATENDDTLLDLENISLSQTSYIMAQDPDTGEWYEYQELISANEHRIWVSLSQIPENLQNAVIATEDREFREHHGVSFTRTVYAMLNEVFEMRSTFGASTIDQQLVKNLTDDRAVSDGDGDRSSGYLRKLREIFRAWGLNNRYSKDMILEVYLNTMGLSEKLVGVQAGAQEYFNKDVSELTLWECATIAGITQAPTYYSPIQNPENALVRRNNVLYFMLEEEYITQAEFDHAVDQPLGLVLTERDNGNETIFSYFSDTVFYEVVEDLMAAYDYTYSEAVNYVYTGGLRIYSTIDVELQEMYEEIYLNGYDEDGYFTNLTNGPGGRAYKDMLTATIYSRDAEGNIVDSYEVLPQSSIVSLRYDGSLAAVVGGIGHKESSLSLNRATQSPRQVGSTIKPLTIYSLGIDLGLINWSSMRNDAPVMFADASKNASGRTDYDWPKNATMSYRRTTIPVVSAITESTNTIAVSIGRDIGESEMFDFLRDSLQVSTIYAKGELVDAAGNDTGTSDEVISAMALGSMSVGMTAYELAGAYQIFGGENDYGVYNSMHSYTRVEDTRGSLVLAPTVITQQAVSTETGYIMNRLLWNVLNGSGLPGNPGATAKGKSPAGDMDAVAKTGTTNDNRDRWFVGLTPYYVTAIWWGYDVNPEGQSTPMSNWSPITYNMTTTLWQKLMTEIQADKEYKEFPAAPENVVRMRYCDVTGLRASEHCGSTHEGYYVDNDPLMDYCPGHSFYDAAQVTEGEG